MIHNLERITFDLLKNLDEKISEVRLGEPHFSVALKKYPFKKENFKPINDRVIIEGDVCDEKLAFVDGGNGEIFGAPNFSIQFNRIYYCMFAGKQRISKRGNDLDRIEFLSSTFATFRNGEIYYDTKIYPLSDSFQHILPNESDLSFDSFNRTIMLGKERADIQRVASIARRFAEWNFATHVVEKELKQKDVMVMDGTLQAAFTNESNYAKRLYDAAARKEVTVTGLAKTSRLFTDTGLSLIGAVQKFAEDCQLGFSSWYFPIAEIVEIDHQAMIFVTKLNPQANHIFRFEIQRDQYNRCTVKETDKLFSMLSENAKDVTFPGYPYGCIAVDSYGRVSEHDIEYYRAIIMGEAAKHGNLPKLVRHMQAVDAHQILNSLVGM